MITDRQIIELRYAAAMHGDELQVAICDIALGIMPARRHDDALRARGYYKIVGLVTRANRDRARSACESAMVGYSEGE